MRQINFLLFFTVVFSIYGLLNFYIFVRGRQALTAHPTLSTVFTVLFLFLALSYLIGRLLERIWLSRISDFLVFVGSFWLAAFLYLFLIVLFIDLLRLVNHFLPFFHYLAADSERLKFTAFTAGISVVFLILLAGYVNACRVQVRRLEIKIDKPCETKELKIAAASDVHLGTIVGRRRFCRIVNKINSLSPDLILFPGDLIDEDIAPVVRENLGEALRSLKAAYGIYAVTGNHEFIGGVERAVGYLQEHGVRVLRDESVLLPNGLYLVGRDDRVKKAFTGVDRKSLRELMQSVDPGKPILLLDHQPFELHEAAEQGVDLQLSGHTHNGQLWPLDLITRATYEQSWGYLKKGHTQYYISCGVGTWGPPIRLGSRPEIVELGLRFNPKEE
ncbi:MAG: metallophosphoesterase [candidate division KSB1 bacterium]|nr:metallophosphoesterase [candidate division KSB1 bacterium]MDZ7346292.1 metallophosphoesterase [candidate division KSB1 bacterium]